MRRSGEHLDSRAESVSSWHQVGRDMADYHRHNNKRRWQDNRFLPYRKWSQVTQSTQLSPSASPPPSHSPYHQFFPEEDPLSFAPSSLEMFQAPSSLPPTKSRHQSKSSCLRTVASILSCSDPLQAAVSALYAKLLIILGLALPLSEVLSEDIQSGYFHLFYVYLFLVSSLYLLFVYIDLLQTRTCHLLASKEGREAGKGRLLEGGQGSYHPPASGYYGSFYLRLGTVVFGIGSLIYTGMELGEIFEMEADTDVARFLRPSLQLVFIFCQMYFVFLNQKMNIYRRKFVTRLGLMHLIATNICVWLKVLILETEHDLLHTVSTRHSSGSTRHSSVSTRAHSRSERLDMYNNLIHVRDANSLLISEDDGVHRVQQHILHKLVEDSGPFLFPCTIEFSLICAAVLFIMWRHVSTEHQVYKLAKLRGIRGFHVPTSSQRYSVDCGRASTGLFLGIVVLVITIISLILFFVLISKEEDTMQLSAVQVAVFSELAIYGVTSVATVVAMVQMRALWYDSSRNLELDNLLLVVAQTGVFLYAAFSIIGAFFQLEHQLVPLLASLLTLAQTTLQTVFILDATCRVACTNSHMVKKPGRQAVTFLLVCNLAMWLLNTLETSRTDAHPMMVKFYGGSWAWPMISHIAMPLAIFYRFHSTVCLFEIWKKSFKLKPLCIATV